MQFLPSRDCQTQSAQYLGRYPPARTASSGRLAFNVRASGQKEARLNWRPHRSTNNGHCSGGAYAIEPLTMVLPARERRENEETDQLHHRRIRSKVEDQPRGFAFLSCVPFVALLPCCPAVECLWVSEYKPIRRVRRFRRASPPIDADADNGD
jgi:hypothetical protein